MLPQLFHIAERGEWDRAHADGRYRTGSLDTEGFIHCCSAAQVAGVAGRYYRGRSDLVLLEIDQSRLDHPVIWENTTGGTERFPHIYGDIDLEAVASADRFTVSDAGELVRGSPSDE